MSVIIRLQNLPWSANALDIRQYFQGLSIPEGGVHIVGGEQGDAFIAFSTDEDARQGMMADGGKIKEVKVKLLLSSRAEMQKVIEMARQQTLALQNFMQMPPQQPTPPIQQAPPPQPHPTHLLGAAAANVMSTLHMQQAAQQHMLVSGNTGIPQQQQQNQPQQPLAQQQMPPGSATVVEKKDNDRGRGADTRRNRSRSRSRDNTRRRSRDKDRDRYRGRRGGRSRSRSRERRRRERSRERSKSRDRGRDRGRRSDNKDSKDKDGKDKTNGNDVVVVGQFPGHTAAGTKSPPGVAGSMLEAHRQQNQQKIAPSAPVVGVNGVLQQALAAVANTTWATPIAGTPIDTSNSPALPAQPSSRTAGNAHLQNPNPANAPRPGNFPPGPADSRGFPFPGVQDQQAWMPRQPGMFPPQHQQQQQQGRMYGDEGPPGRGGFRGGPPGRPGRASRFEPMEGGRGGPMEFSPADGPFPPQRGRGERFPSYEENFRGGQNNRPFNRDNPRGGRLIPHTCVEMRNMPVSAAYRDVREFFNGMHVLNIKLINDDQGRRTGVGYIRFMSIENKEAALSMNGIMLHGTPLEILHLDDHIYEEALDSYTPNAEAIVVALHGLPHYANEKDIERLFPGARLLNLVVARSSNPHAPQAFVQFSTIHEGKRAMAASGKLTVDKKEIYVERSSIDMLMNAKKMMEEMGPEVHNSDKDLKEKSVATRPRDSSPVTSDCVLLQGLPPSANDREILDFFSDVGLVPLRIHVMLDGSNTPSGDAFCEFSSCAEGARALGKNGNVLGSKEVTVRGVARHEMEEALGILEQKHHEEKIVPRSVGQGPVPGRNGPMHPEHMRGGHMGGPPMRGGLLVPGEFMGRGGRHFVDMRGGPHMRGGHRGMHHGGGPPMMGRPPIAPPHQEVARDSPTVDNFGKPGCVIELQNVPYKAEIEEIIDYFEGFEVTRPNVIRRYSDNGMPTGDARVALRSPAEAQRAMQELKFKKMRDRPIYLNLI